jgi:hypothetical protein
MLRLSYHGDEAGAHAVKFSQAELEKLFQDNYGTQGQCPSIENKAVNLGLVEGQMYCTYLFTGDFPDFEDKIRKVPI